MSILGRYSFTAAIVSWIEEYHRHAGLVALVVVVPRVVKPVREQGYNILILFRI